PTSRVRSSDLIYVDDTVIAACRGGKTRLSHQGATSPPGPPLRNGRGGGRRLQSPPVERLRRAVSRPPPRGGGGGRGKPPPRADAGPVGILSPDCVAGTCQELLVERARDEDDVAVLGGVGLLRGPRRHPPQRQPATTRAGHKIADDQGQGPGQKAGHAKDQGP